MKVDAFLTQSTLGLKRVATLGLTLNIVHKLPALELYRNNQN